MEFSSSQRQWEMEGYRRDVWEMKVGAVLGFDKSNNGCVFWLKGVVNGCEVGKLQVGAQLGGDFGELLRRWVEGGSKVNGGNPCGYTPQVGIRMHESNWHCRQLTLFLFVSAGDNPCGYTPQVGIRMHESSWHCRQLNQWRRTPHP
ncbi:hypothetical protein V6N13_124824 [Hibiscus sabdariffa]